MRAPTCLMTLLLGLGLAWAGLEATVAVAGGLMALKIAEARLCR